MKIETNEPEEIKLEMTSMIDIVFQLLVFFIMTFKVVVMEGDFSVKMPLSTKEAVNMTEELPDVVRVQLLAGESGGIASIFVNDSPMPVNDIFGNLNDEIYNLVRARERDPESNGEIEVEFDIDRKLKYSFTVKAIDAVTGRVDSNRKVEKLIEKIKFKDNSTSL